MKSSVQKIQHHILRLKETLPLFTEEILALRPGPGKWSKKEILGHLVDSARYNLQRFTEIPLRENGTYQVRSYPQDELVTANNYQEMLSEEIIILWQSLNYQICHVLYKLPASCLDLQVIIGEETKPFDWLINDYIIHLEHHLKQILEDQLPELDLRKFHITPGQAATKLEQSPQEFITLLKNNDLEIEYYAPVGTDKQQPHDKDELYIIAKGKAEFLLEEQRVVVSPHDVLFVPAGKEHRFVDFSDDFATWVVFWGMSKL